MTSLSSRILTYANYNKYKKYAFPLNKLFIYVSITTQFPRLTFKQLMLVLDLKLNKNNLIIVY